MKHYIIFLSVFILCFVKARETTIDFTLIDNKIYLKELTIEGQKYAGLYLIDTGSDKTLLNSDVFSNIPNGKTQTIDTYYEKLHSHIVFNEIAIDTFSFGKLNIYYSKGYIFSESCYTEKISGIIGRDILSQKNWKFDMKNKTITISDTPFNTKGYSQIPLIKKGKYSRWYASMYYNSKQHHLLLDTGSSVEISLKNKRNLHFSKYSSFGTKKVDMVSYTDDVVLFHHNAFEAHITESKYLSSSLGMGFLARFHWILNENDNNLYIIAHKKFEKKEVQIKYGFSVMCENNTTIISDIYKNSIAEKAGLKVFDKVQYFNTINVNECSCSLLNNLKTEFEKDNITLIINDNQSIYLYSKSYREHN